MYHAALAVHERDQPRLDTIVDELVALPSRLVAAAQAYHLERGVALSWETGWQPLDLTGAARRHLDAHAADIVASAVLAQRRHYRHEQCWCSDEWQAQVDGLETQFPVRSIDGWFADVVATAGARDAVLYAAPALNFLLSAPDIPLLRPPPSRWSLEPARRDRSAMRDPQLLDRVRGLLAKAEATDFPEEAEAFTAKAQELMARHRIDRALLDAAEPATVDACRIQVGNPYPEARSLLLQHVAEANGGRSVWSADLGFATVFAEPDALDFIETLYTSLLVQATTAVQRSGSRRDAAGRSRTRSFRKSFLLAYAARIGERLEIEVAGVADGLDSDERAAALPVLARARDDVDEAVASSFPKMTQKRMHRTDADGFAAGRAAAELADLAAGPAVDRVPRPGA